MISRHKVQRGQSVWALVQGVPMNIIFGGLLAYHGFMRLEGDRGINVPDDDAVFSETKEELIAFEIERLACQITELHNRIEWLKGLKSNG